MPNVVITVKPGDTLVSLARANKVTPASIKDLPENAALFARRRWPNLLAPGDAITIPDVSSTMVPSATGATRLVIPSASAPLELYLQDSAGQPLGDLPWEITGAGAALTGTLAGGKLTVRIPIASTQLQLRCGALRWTLQVGALVPLTDVSVAVRDQGIKQRLRNLGFRGVPQDDLPFDAAAKLVLAAFQAQAGLVPAQGVVDAATLAALEAAHGC